MPCLPCYRALSSGIQIPLRVYFLLLTTIPGPLCLHYSGDRRKKFMPVITNSESTLYISFLQPLRDVLARCRKIRACKSLPDQQWLTLGTLRVLLEYVSGRAFLQHLLPHLTGVPSLPLFFENLKSARRLGLCAEANARLRDELTATLPDALADYPQLDGFGIFAGDGTCLKAACHDTAQSSRCGDTKYATGHFFGMDMRTQAMLHLAVADQDERKREHDIRALKRIDPADLRQGTPKGRKVLWAWDRAITDFALWHKLKQGHGIYFITRQKENFAGMNCGDIPFEMQAKINNGVLRDEQVGGGGVTIRRITFHDPLSGNTYQFLTNEMTLPPGLLALVYKMRWDIEKSFDQAKNKFGEKKSWASSATAKAMQAQFLCIAHNLALMQEHKLSKDEGITNVAEIKRKQKRLDGECKELKAKGISLPLALQSLQRVTQRSVKFIRWLRMFLFLQTPWQSMIDVLRKLYATS